MPRIQTKYFGALEFSPSGAVRFPNGLPAFEQEHDFLLIEPPARKPLVFLQSARDPELCFLALPALAIDPAYELSLNAEELAALELAGAPGIGREVDCLALIAAPDGAAPTVNLLAPIVIHRATRIAVQAVRSDSRYSHRHPLPVPEEKCS
jgi:flagellar assembly factor FliW